MKQPNPPTKVRFHSRPAQLDIGAVVRVTNLTPQQLEQLETFIKQQLGGQRYNS
ncbi:MAG TPA: hypothetical protein VF690_06850 [Hymenobacter sp.]